jgi:hypothetical protein
VCLALQSPPAMNLRPSVSKKTSSSSCCIDCLGERHTVEIVKGQVVSSTITLVAYR